MWIEQLIPKQDKSVESQNFKSEIIDVDLTVNNKNQNRIYQNYLMQLSHQPKPYNYLPYDLRKQKKKKRKSH